MSVISSLCCACLLGGYTVPQGQLTVLATASDTVGGRDLDMILHKHFAAEFKEKYKIDVSTNPRAAIRLENECEKVRGL